MTHQDFLNGVRAPVPKPAVELGRTAIVTVAFEDNDQVWEIAKDLVQCRRSSRDTVALGRCETGRSEGEMNVWARIRDGLRDPFRSRQKNLVFRNWSDAWNPPPLLVLQAVHWYYWS